MEGPHRGPRLDPRDPQIVTFGAEGTVRLCSSRGRPETALGLPAGAVPSRRPEEEEEGGPACVECGGRRRRSGRSGEGTAGRGRRSLEQDARSSYSLREGPPADTLV